MSITTVSNVLNRRFNMMSASTLAHVQQVISDLGYHPNASGRKLRLRRRFSVGVIVIGSQPAFLVDPFITEIVAGMTNMASALEYGLVLHGCPANRLEEAALLRSREVDAVALVFSGSAEERELTLATARQLAMPLLFVQEPLPNGLVDACSVRQDDAGGGRLLAEHLIDRGAHNLAMIIPEVGWHAVQERVRGVSEALANRAKDRGSLAILPCEEMRFLSPQEVLEQHVAAVGIPDAVLCANDQIGISVSQWLRARSLRIPQDIQVTGFNGFSLRNYSEPLLTSVVSAAYEMGQSAAKALVDRLTTGKFELRELVFPVELAEGASTLGLVRED